VLISPSPSTVFPSNNPNNPAGNSHSPSPYPDDDQIDKSQQIEGWLKKGHGGLGKTGVERTKVGRPFNNPFDSR
jgi:hypothetical protein